MRLLGAVFLLLVAPAPRPPAAQGEAIAVESTPVALNPADPSQASVDRLAWRGGLVLRSPDKRFGGLSDLVVSPDGQELTAVSDEGTFLTARLRYDARGFLVGLEGAALHAMRDTRAEVLKGKQDQDAEAMARLEDGSILVGFEHWHRLWRYASGLDGRAEALASPEGMRRSPENNGVETLVALSHDRLLAIPEETPRGGVLQGWLRTGPRWTGVGYRVEGTLRPSGGCALSSGDLVILERDFSTRNGVTARLRRLPGAALKPGALLEGTVLATLARPLTEDNFEGLACRAGAGGEALLYLVADDNLSPSQRTLLLAFALKDGS